MSTGHVTWERVRGGPARREPVRRHAVRYGHVTVRADARRAGASRVGATTRRMARPRFGDGECAENKRVVADCGECARLTCNLRRVRATCGECVQIAGSACKLRRVCANCGECEATAQGLWRHRRPARGRGLRLRSELARTGGVCSAAMARVMPLSSERQHQSRTEAGPECGERPRPAEPLRASEAGRVLLCPAGRARPLVSIEPTPRANVDWSERGRAGQHRARAAGQRRRWLWRGLVQ